MAKSRPRFGRSASRPDGRSTVLQAPPFTSRKTPFPAALLGRSTHPDGEPETSAAQIGQTSSAVNRRVSHCPAGGQFA